MDSTWPARVPHTGRGSSSSVSCSPSLFITADIHFADKLLYNLALVGSYYSRMVVLAAPERKGPGGVKWGYPGEELWTWLKAGLFFSPQGLFNSF